MHPIADKGFGGMRMVVACFNLTYALSGGAHVTPGCDPGVFLFNPSETCVHLIPGNP